MTNFTIILVFSRIKNSRNEKDILYFAGFNGDKRFKKVKFLKDVWKRKPSRYYQKDSQDFI